MRPLKKILILCPPPLVERGLNYQRWANSKQTPTEFKCLSAGLKCPITEDVVWLVLYSNNVSESYYTPLIDKLYFLGPKELSNIYLWPIDGPLLINRLFPICDDQRLKSLSLITGDFTLPVALCRAHQASPQEINEDLTLLRSDSDTSCRVTYTLTSLELHLEKMKRYGKLSRLPIICGLLITMYTLVAAIEEEPKIWVAFAFVFAQLLLGIGILGTIWSFFELSNMRYRVFTLWTTRSSRAM